MIHYAPVHPWRTGKRSGEECIQRGEETLEAKRSVSRRLESTGSEGPFICTAL